MDGLISELKRRNVVRVAVAYGVVSWVIIQVTGEAVPALNLPEWVGSLVFFLLLIGMPIAILFAWAFELTPDGLKRTREVDVETSVTGVTGQKINLIIIGALVLALGYFIWERQSLQAERDATITAEAEVEQGPVAKSVAVLPFVNMSNDPDQEFFSDGISEELLNVLAKMPDLKVAARTSSFQFKGDNRDISDIGRQLGVAYVLEGSVRKSGTRLRITAQLINVNDSFHIWSETYDRELTDIFAIQDEISAAIAKALQVHLGVETTPTVEGEVDGEVRTASIASLPRVTRTVSPEIYEHYLLGRQLISRRTKTTLEAAVEHFEAVLTGDPDYAPAWAGLGEAVILLENAACCYGDLSREEMIARAEPALRRAVELDPDLAEAWAPLALLLDRKDEDDAALQAINRAIEINPNYAYAYIWKAAIVRDPGEAFEAEIKALELDPLNLVANFNMGRSLGRRGRFDEARKIFTKIEQLAPGRSLAILGENTWQQGDRAGAMASYLRALEAQPGDPRARLFVGFLLLELGQPDVAAPLGGNLAILAKWAAGDDAAALEMARAEFLTKPDNIGSVARFGRALMRTGDVAGAQRQYERLFEISQAAGSGNTLNLAWLRRQSGDEEGALEMIARVRAEVEKRRAAGLKMFSLDGDEARLLYMEGRVDEGMAMLDEAVARGWMPRPNTDFALPDYVLNDPRFLAALARIDGNRAAALKDIADQLCNPESELPESELKASICGSLAGS